MLVPERKFEKIDSKEVSKPIDNDILLLKENFDKESIIYSVYMDPLGKIYYSESPIKIQDQNKKFNFFEMNVLPKEFLFYLQRR